MEPPPPGFVPLARTSPVLDLIGPIYSRGTGAELVLGLRADTKHANARGWVHGGILATLADVALGYCLESLAEYRSSLVTVSLSLDYAGTARAGEWIESRVDVQHLGGRLAFANAYLVSGATRLVRASGVFLVSERQTKTER